MNKDVLNNIYKSALGKGVRSNIPSATTPVVDKSYVKDATNRLSDITLSPKDLKSERYSYTDREKTASNDWKPQSKTKGIIQKVLSYFKKNDTSNTPNQDKLSPDGWFRGVETKKGVTTNNRKNEYEKRRADIYQKALEDAKNARGGKRVSQADKDTANKVAEDEMREGKNRELTMDVPSTALKSIRYNPKTKGLTVQFTSSNKKYFYPDVPMDEVENLVEASSKGNYFMNNIHDQYSIYGSDHSKKSKSQQKGIKKYQRAYNKTNKKAWEKNGGK